MDALAAGAGGALLGDDGPVPLVVFKMLLLQHCYGLCDPQCEELVGDRLCRGGASSGWGWTSPCRTRPRWCASASGRRRPTCTNACSGWSTRSSKNVGLILGRVTLVDTTLLQAARRAPAGYAPTAGLEPGLRGGQTERGTRFRVLTLLDEHTRGCLAMHVAWSIRAVDVITVITVVEAAMQPTGPRNTSGATTAPSSSPTRCRAG